ncbi:MAG TPA: hypothetical protein PK833_13495, partial [Vicingus sp.]|nr:hypothetical protein [Vicingus sp.]
MSTKSSLTAVYLKKNKPDIALQFGLDALSISNEMGTKENSKTLYRLISQSYVQKGNYQKAYEYQNKYVFL